MVEKNDGKAHILRLGRILRSFMEHEKVYSTKLSQLFQVTPRTIQRDLRSLKEAGFPIHELQKGVYELRKDLIKNLEVFDDTELALVVALKNIVGQLGQPFQKAADGVLDRLYDSATSMPVFVKIDDSVPLDSVLLGKLIRAAKERRQVFFEYHADRGTHPVTLEPYRVVYFAGFWYLVGNEPVTGILKRYALDRISDLKVLKVRFKTIPVNLDDMLKGSSSIWFSDSKRLAVKVLVDAPVAHYFKRKRMHPSQEIKEERPDGSIVVTFHLGQYEEIRNILKSWIPYIVILGPQKFKMDLLDDVKGWVKRQEELSDLT